MPETAQHLVFVDVGAEGGLKDTWVLDEDISLLPIVFEPSEQRASALRAQIEGELKGRVMAVALGGRAEDRVFHLTGAPGCSSILPPHNGSLAPFSVRHAFDIRSQQVVHCERFDWVALRENLPPPDAVKIDVQGFEFDVLTGFGNFLDHVLAIELESHIYPLYHEQKLLGDMVQFLQGHGFYLRKMETVDHFDGYAVEVDVWFTKGPVEVSSLDAIRQRKLSCIEKTWKLPERREIFRPEMFR